MQKLKINQVITFWTIMGCIFLALFIYLLAPKEKAELSKDKVTTENMVTAKSQDKAYEDMMQKFSEAQIQEENRKESIQSEPYQKVDQSRAKVINEAPQDTSLKVVYEDDFSKNVVLPNGSVTPVLKSNILGDSEEIEAKFKFEARNEQWASNWEHTLNNIVASAGAQFNSGGYNITCKSKTCKIGVKLSQDNPYGYDEAFRALNKEFVINEMKVVPGPIKEEGTNHIVYYYFPDG
ncbi:MAG: hypothetical protein R3213_11200 [Flavobacteriaceae bacterium]|nr:hypothetical protein [Flavobacteriaceae bacterium]